MIEFAPRLVETCSALTNLREDEVRAALPQVTRFGANGIVCDGPLGAPDGLRDRRTRAWREKHGSGAMEVLHTRGIFPWAEGDPDGIGWRTTGSGLVSPLRTQDLVPVAAHGPETLRLVREVLTSTIRPARFYWAPRSTLELRRTVEYGVSSALAPDTFLRLLRDTAALLHGKAVATLSWWACRRHGGFPVPLASSRAEPGMAEELARFTDAIPEEYARLWEALQFLAGHGMMLYAYAGTGDPSLRNVYEILLWNGEEQ